MEFGIDTGTSYLVQGLVEHNFTICGEWSKGGKGAYVTITVIGYLLEMMIR